MDDINVPEMDGSSSVPQNPDLPTVCSTGFSAISAGAVPSYPALSEVSGVVASRQRSDLLWMHNDSGGEPILYAVGTDGAQRGRYSVPGDAIDWEDLALAACPDGVGECIWVGDIGDNRRARTSVNILVVPEPCKTEIPGRSECGHFNCNTKADPSMPKHSWSIQRVDICGSSRSEMKARPGYSVTPLVP